MLQALRSVKLPAEFESGFIGAQVFAEAGEADSLCYSEEWETQEDLEREIRSPRFSRLLAVVETAAGLPTLEIHLIAETRGWNYVRGLRDEPSAAEGGNGSMN